MFFQDTLEIFRQASVVIHQELSNDIRGRHTSRFLGRGIVLGPSREFRSGDDARFIDKVTSRRMGKLYVRQRLIRSSAPVMFVVDCGFSAIYGYHGLKIDAAHAVVGSLAQWHIDEGNRVQALLTDGVETVDIPIGKNEAVVQSISDGINDLARKNRNVAPNLGETLRDAEYLQNAEGNGLVYFVSDCYGDDWQDSLADLAVLNDVVVIQPVDPEEESATPFRGVVQVARKQSRVARNKKRFRQRDKLATARQDQIESDILDIGASHLILKTHEPWDVELLQFLHDEQMKGA